MSLLKSRSLVGGHVMDFSSVVDISRCISNFAMTAPFVAVLRNLMFTLSLNALYSLMSGAIVYLKVLVVQIYSFKDRIGSAS